MGKVVSFRTILLIQLCSNVHLIVWNLNRKVNFVADISTRW